LFYKGFSAAAANSRGTAKEPRYERVHVNVG
jgi:hypothetical protein